jgi:trehalose/maltose hydrolase-like predicted phosphorylase
MHALVAARLGDFDMPLRYLRETGSLDLDPDPNSAGGVRIAGLGGLWLAIVLGLGEIDFTRETLGIDPRLPPQWHALSFCLCWRRRTMEIRITTGSMEIKLRSGEAMGIEIAGAIHILSPGGTTRVSL